MKCGRWLELWGSDPKHCMEHSVIKCRNRQDDGQDVEPGKISAREDQTLKDDRHYSRNCSQRLRKDITKRSDQFGEMVEPDTRTMSPHRAPVKIPAQRIWHRLRFVVVVQ